jgi:hypothetical protein
MNRGASAAVFNWDVMQTILTYVWAMLVSLLPQRYRIGSPLHGSRELWLATILCGLAQAGVFALVLLLRFMSQINSFMGEAGDAVLAVQTGPTMDVMQVRLASGVLGLAGFILQPLTLPLAYLAAEGAVRALAAAAVGEVRGTLPLYLVAFMQTRLEQAGARMKLGPLVVDEIRPPLDQTYDLHVLSCRPKPDWNRYITVRFRDEFYIVAGEEQMEGPRPFVFRLRKNPAGRLVVVVRDYQLDDPLRKS